MTETLYAAPSPPEVSIVDAGGARYPLDASRVRAVVEQACRDVDGVDPAAVLDACWPCLYDGMSAAELDEALVMSARTLIETEPGYSRVTARLLLDTLRGEALSYLAAAVAGGSTAERPGASHRPDQEQMRERYPGYFTAFVHRAVELGQLDPAMARFDLARVGAALVPDRDLSFEFLGLRTLYDRYLLHDGGIRYELPQAFFMRVAMGLALREDDPDRRAVEFYELLSTFRFMASTPTLFNAGTTRPQLSSCFLTTVDDSLDAIFRSYRNNALLAKYSGGLGNDWTPVRGLGAHIAGTNGKSQGVVPFLKIANDTAIAVNQGGKRKGAACAYLETWHIDIEEFLELRKNTGDERRRTHDMNTANWVPDEFLRRVVTDGEWTLFSPDEVPDLHELYGHAFAERYRAYEHAARRGEIRVHRTVRAVDLWRRMLTMLFETGHPWITFKDPCNLRSPQRHAGVVHSSNLCTEITLNTSAEEVAVCNLGSVNLAAHLSGARIDDRLLESTVRTAVRMLDNVIDINFYTVDEARAANLRHRPIGLGVMGYAETLFAIGAPVDSEQAVEFADRSMELVSYHAIDASSRLAAERGRYESYEGSLWSEGILPIDSLRLLAGSREDGECDVDTSTTLAWQALRERVRQRGMRNSTVLAVAPTATIANICGVSPSVEPVFRNLYVKSNMSGEFTVINPCLVEDLKRHGLWDEEIAAELKRQDGSLATIDRVPEQLKRLYATAFEIDSRWLVEAASRRQKWIDQAQSLNLYIDTPSGRALDELYRHAWRKGLKTTYYLRTRAATRVEKSTLDRADGALNAVPATVTYSCGTGDEDCEACQ
ncbi:ribonucleoside-diphosphate reductase subunit alpha [Haloechinothrix sp. LS1_15]|uniref:ribonucleoside-diphosphate reductase subunit alpha n=1 Tax=Haloechinothrix sp. LS1_15 TaxID=2652248 RepID=UPI0037BF6FAA